MTTTTSERDRLVSQMAATLGQWPQYAGYIDAPTVYRLRKRWVGKLRNSMLPKGALAVGGALETREEQVPIIDPTRPRSANIIGFRKEPRTAASIYCPGSGHMCHVDVAYLEPVEVA